MTAPSNIVPPPPGKAPPPHKNPGAPRHAKSAPPEWPIETFISKIGLVPAALKRFLDRAAKIRGLNWFFALFTSVWFGISLLFLIGLYVGIGSGFASLRAKLEMTDLQFFDAWPMVTLIILLSVNLTIVTLRRIPLTLFKVGVWTVHIGILTLLTGCVWYFSQKTEGSVRIFLNQSVHSYYDVTERSLYAYNIKPDGTPDAASATMTPLPKLPYFFEHIAEKNNALDMPVPVETALAPLDPALKDASLKIVGYYPYATLETAWEPAEEDAAASTPVNRALLIGFTASGTTDGKWFVANSPAGRLYDAPEMPFALEYLYHPTAEQLADIQAEISGPLGITVRIPKSNLTRTYTVETGKPFPVEGTPYSLLPGDQMPMQVISKGYEGAFSNNLMVHVVRKDSGNKQTLFDRMVLARYPEISPDFIALPDGKQKRIQERVDNDIQLTFHDAQRDQLWMVENENGPADKKVELFHRKAGGGAVERFPVEIGKPVNVQVGRAKMQFVAMAETDHAVEGTHPQIVPPEQRERGQTAMDAMQFSIVELSLTRGNIRDKHFFVPFVQFAQIGAPPLGRQPTIVNIPGAGVGGKSAQVGFLLSTTRRELPNAVKLSDFKAVKYAGAANTYEDYVSTLDVTDKAGKSETLVARLNEPAASHGLYYFQSGWDGNDNASPSTRFSILGIGNRPGLTTMLVGAILIFAGIGFAFYVKPILLNAKKKYLADWAAAQKLNSQ